MLHFSDMTLEPEDIPVLVRGDGCHIYDDHGNRYIDGLSGLYCTNLGHSHGEEIGAAAAAQMATLPFTTNWTTAHPPSIELAREARRAGPRRASSASSSPPAAPRRSSRPTRSRASGTRPTASRSAAR